MHLAPVLTIGILKRNTLFKMEFEKLTAPGSNWYHIKIENNDVRKNIIATSHIPTNNKNYDVAVYFNDVFQRKYLSGHNSIGSPDHIFQAVTKQNTERSDIKEPYDKCFRTLKIQTITDTPEVYKVKIKWKFMKGRMFLGNDGYIWVDADYVNLGDDKGEYFGNVIKAMNNRIKGIFDGINTIDIIHEDGNGGIKVFRPKTNDYVLIKVTKHTIEFKIEKCHGKPQRAVEHMFYKHFYKKLIRMMHPEVKALNLLKIK